jgi:hypothetical protein
MKKSLSCDFCKAPIHPSDFEKGKAVTLLKRNYCDKCMALAVQKSRREHAPSQDFVTPRAIHPRSLHDPTPRIAEPAAAAHRHRRGHERKETSIAVELSIYLRDGRLHDRGRAVLRDVSLSGALLGALVLPQKTIPVEPHTVGIRVLEGSLKDFEILGRPVRFVHLDDGIRLAIEFVKIEEAHLVQLRKIV